MKRAVIVGCGNIAAVHAAVLTAQKDTELVGVADIHFEKAKDYAEKWAPVADEIWALWKNHRQSHLRSLIN